MAATNPAAIAHMVTLMRLDHGSGPAGATCEHCAHLRTVTGKSRMEINGKAHNSQSMTLFRCVFVPSEPWSLRFEACARFQRTH